MNYAEKSPKEIINELFENENIRALMTYAVCYWGIEYEQNGLGYLVLLLLNRTTNYRLCAYGSHKIASALGRIIMENGGQIRTSILIKRIIIENGTATGVELDDGTVYEAGKAVASSIDPHQTFLKLVGREALDKEFVEKIEGWMWEKWSLLTIHLAIEGRPNFAAATNPDVNNALVYLVGYETVDDLIKHWQAIDRGEIKEGAGFNCCFPSVHDSVQAPQGRCSGLISQMAPYQLQGGVEMWYNREFREEQIQRCLDVLEKYAPGIKGQVLWAFLSSPLDMENKLSDMVRGSFKQGAYNPFQMGYNRPNDECSWHRTPVKNLYLCGASSHSGGMVTFGPGYIAANRIADDLGIKKWWTEPEIVTSARKRGLL